jgi:hypothetical protein
MAKLDEMACVRATTAIFAFFREILAKNRRKREKPLHLFPRLKRNPVSGR